MTNTKSGDYHFFSISSITCWPFTYGIVTWYPTETIEIRLILSSRWNEQWQPVKKVTVKKECRSQRGYQQVLVLSNLRSPDTKGEKREAKWLAGAPKRKWGLLPLSVNNKKVSCLAGFVAGRRTKASIPGWRQKNIWDTRDPRFFEPV